MTELLDQPVAAADAFDAAAGITADALVRTIAPLKAVPSDQNPLWPAIFGALGEIRTVFSNAGQRPKPGLTCADTSQGIT
jgi:hypothetical protein